MPKLCPRCDGGRTVLKITLKWWERLLGRPDVQQENCPTCNGTGGVPGTLEEEAAYARQAAEQEAWAASRAAADEARARRKVTREPLTDTEKR